MESYTWPQLVWGPAIQAGEMFKGNGFWKQQESPKLKAAFKRNQVGLILQGCSYTCRFYIITLLKIPTLLKHCTIITIWLKSLQTVFSWLWNRTANPMRIFLKNLGVNSIFAVLSWMIRKIQVLFRSALVFRTEAL